MINRMSNRPNSKIGKVFLYILLSVLGVAFIIPFYWMFVSSLKFPSQIFTFPPQIIPSEMTLKNYRTLFSETHYLRNLLNSVLIAGSSTLLSIIFCSMGGFGFAKYNFPAKKILFYILLGTMMIPHAVRMIPLYTLMTKIHWVDTYQAVIFPGLANAFGIFWMRQYMSTIPDDLMDAARIDGCSDFRIYWNIFLPVAKPAIAALAILLFMQQWNMFMWPLVILRSEEMLTVTVMLAQLEGVTYTPYGQILAGSAMATLPILIVFFLMQKQFIAGITRGAIKS